MAMHLLDTDICIYLLNGQAPLAEERLRDEPLSDMGTTTITAAELRYGALHSARPKANLARVEVFLSPLSRWAFDEAASFRFAETKERLVRLGRPIGVMDLLIASIALASDAVLVTNNTREFGRVTGLNVENWMR